MTPRGCGIQEFPCQEQGNLILLAGPKLEWNQRTAVKTCLACPIPIKLEGDPLT